MSDFKAGIFVTLSAVLIASALVNMSTSESKSSIPASIHTLYSKWRVRHGVTRDTPAENMFRLQTFYNNYKEIQEIRKQNPEAEFTMNRFADMTLEEKQSTLTGYKPLSKEEVENIEFKAPSSNKRLLFSAPEAYMIPNIRFAKDQGFCKNDWAFTAAAMAEDVLNGAVDISVQNMVDCMNSAHCSDTNIHEALAEIEKDGYLEYSKKKYTMLPQKCITSQKKIDFNHVTAQKKGTSGYYHDMSASTVKTIIATEDASVGVPIYAGPEFFAYKSGVLTPRPTGQNTNYMANCSERFANHYVAIVGYEADHWVMKNSWGQKWGNNGFFKLRINPLMHEENDTVCFCGKTSAGCEFTYVHQD